VNVVVGIDAVDIKRMGRMLSLSPQRFAKLAWTDAEREYCRGRSDRYAARWAAKEAVMKALGGGFSTLDPLEIEVLSVESQRPVLLLHGSASAEAARQGVVEWSLSMTHEDHLALAVVAGIRRVSHD
jgi:holo-[acyl-carrier protein] synthase